MPLMCASCDTDQGPSGEIVRMCGNLTDGTPICTAAHICKYCIDRRRHHE